MQLGLLSLVAQRRDIRGRLGLRGDTLRAHALQVAHPLVELYDLVRGALGRCALGLQPDRIEELLLPLEAHLERLEDWVVVDVHAYVHDRRGGRGLEVGQLAVPARHAAGVRLRLGLS